jgi:Resolvase, N terminal domain
LAIAVEAPFAGGEAVPARRCLYDPRHPNDRLLLGMKGTMSEMELSLFRQRSLEALKQKARRGWPTPSEDRDGCLRQQDSAHCLGGHVTQRRLRCACRMTAILAAG